MHPRGRRPPFRSRSSSRPGPRRQHGAADGPGTPKVGRTLSAARKLDPSDGVVRLPVARRRGPDRGAASPRTFLQAGDVGKKISVRVTASRTTPPTASRPRPRPRHGHSGQPPITEAPPPTIRHTTPQVGQALNLDRRHFVAASATWRSPGSRRPTASTSGSTTPAMAPADRARSCGSGHRHRTRFRAGTATSVDRARRRAPRRDSQQMVSSHRRLGQTSPQQRLVPGDVTWPDSGCATGRRSAGRPARLHDGRRRRREGHGLRVDRDQAGCTQLVKERRTNGIAAGTIADSVARPSPAPQRSVAR